MSVVHCHLAAAFGCPNCAYLELVTLKGCVLGSKFGQISSDLEIVQCRLLHPDWISPGAIGQLSLF